jgi:hypothetical protein
VRIRGLIHALTTELFGVSLALPDVPRVRSLAGLGLSDAELYAERLRDRFDYRNTYYAREPRLDLLNPPPSEIGRYDFAIASEIFEHIPAPVDRAFENVRSLLKPNGALILTVPYSLDARTREHFPHLHRFAFAQVAGQTVLVNQRPDGALDVTGGIVLHVGCEGPAPEFREFSEADLRASLSSAGFCEARVYSDNYPQFGILHAETCSLPIVARKGTYCMSADGAREIVEQWRDAHHELKRLGGTWWFRVGRKLGMCQ